jgi:hypothetical protein
MSVAVVRMPLVTSNAASLCTLLICVAKPWTPHPFSLFPLPFLSSSVPHLSIVYSVLGMATASYSFFIRLPFIPFIVFVIRPHASTYLVPLMMAYVVWSLKHSSSSSITPRNSHDHWGVIWWLWIVTPGWGVGVVLPLVFGSCFLVLVRHRSAVFSSSNSALYLSPHLSALSSFSISRLSFSLASSKVLPLAVKAVSSIKPKLIETTNTH